MWFPGGSVVKNPPAIQEMQFDTWIRKIPWRRKWQSISVFLPVKFHGQRSLVGYSPLDRKKVRYDLRTKTKTANATKEAAPSLSEGGSVCGQEQCRQQCWPLRGEWEAPGTQLEWAKKCMQSNKRHSEELKAQCNSDTKLSLEFCVVREDCIKEWD